MGSSPGASTNTFPTIPFICLQLLSFGKTQELNSSWVFYCVNAINRITQEENFTLIKIYDIIYLQSKKGIDKQMLVIKNILMIVVRIILFTISIGLCIEFIGYGIERYYTDIEPITFKTFISLYHTNTYRWSWKYGDSHLRYVAPKGGSYDVAFKYFISCFRFHIWRFMNKRRKRKEQRLKETAQILDCWQADVNRHKAKSEKEIAAAAKELIKQSSELTGLSEATLALINKVKENI